MTAYSQVSITIKRLGHIVLIEDTGASVTFYPTDKDKTYNTILAKCKELGSDLSVDKEFALLSLIESIRNEPVKYSSLIYYSMSKQQQYSSSQNYFIEHRTAMLVQEAEKLYNKLLTDLSNRLIHDAAFSSETLSSLPSPSSSSDGTTTKSFPPQVSS